MKLLLNVSIYEHCDFGADYALVCLTPEFAKRILKRRDLWRTAKVQDTALYELTFWGIDVDWIHRGDGEDPGTEAIDFDEWIDGFVSPEQLKQLSGGDPVQVPGSFTVPEHFHQRTECAQMVMVDDEIRFTSYPRHIDFEQSTSGIPFELVEQAAGIRKAV